MHLSSLDVELSNITVPCIQSVLKKNKKNLHYAHDNAGKVIICSIEITSPIVDIFSFS